ncbi:MAG: hypothetical protein CBE00_10345 [Planctomycetaceae bacterium TMED240]|nr:hypothetical protein [Rhodopirellula sp.]OUX05513.1 MAG: hypothetical protein CBE00_10345 [Planctomycetaceae bacterium TMED240]
MFIQSPKLQQMATLTPCKAYEAAIADAQNPRYKLSSHVDQYLDLHIGANDNGEYFATEMQGNLMVNIPGIQQWQSRKSCQR